MPAIWNPQVGQISPSQLLYTYGIGAIVDLPQLSAIVTGLDDWPRDPSVARVIAEGRLLRAVRARLGNQVQQLVFPPVVADGGALPNPFDEGARVGVPVAAFPRWMVCPSCRLLAPLKSDLFELKTNPYHPDRTHFEHASCTKPGKRPTVVPARFLAACERGHLDDFPWLEFVHRGLSECGGPLRLSEYGPSGEARDLEVRCEGCGKQRRMADAFGKENRQNLPLCRGRRPHLRDFDPDGCGEDIHMRAILLGASNSWFPVVLSTIAIPDATSRLDVLVEQNWATLQMVTNFDRLAFSYETGQLGAFAGYSLEAIWEAIERRRAAESAAAQADERPDLREPEWEVLSNPEPARNSTDFRLRRVEAPEAYRQAIAQIVLAERLREVKALVGFTRIDAPGEWDELDPEEMVNTAPIARRPPTWVPAVEVRGEGIFIQFDEAALQNWLRRAEVREHDLLFLESHTRWRRARYADPPEANYPTLRYVLLHSFSHALIRQLALECGYTSASLRERIYSRNPDEPGGPMAGILIYTAAPDSEGTLGGLVSLGEPRQLERHIAAALESARLCASDPTCAEHSPDLTGASVHAAACHACLFASETSCEQGNRYLDRTLLVETIERGDLAFFADAGG